jgi:CheY-like chemotaxis protein
MTSRPVLQIRRQKQAPMATILLVDDDPLLAIRRKSLLEKRFTDVQRVSDAAEALCLIEQPLFANQLGLVISGHHMPGLGGPAFVAELCNRMPALPVLVLGTGGEDATDYFSDHVCFVPLPIDSDEMVNLAGQLIALHSDKNADATAA